MDLQIMLFNICNQLGWSTGCLLLSLGIQECWCCWKQNELKTMLCSSSWWCVVGFCPIPHIIPGKACARSLISVALDAKVIPQMFHGAPWVWGERHPQNNSPIPSTWENRRSLSSTRTWHSSRTTDRIRLRSLEGKQVWCQDFINAVSCPCSQAGISSYKWSSVVTRHSSPDQHSW